MATSRIPFLYLMSYIISCLSKLNVSEIFRDMRYMQILIQCINDSHIFLFNIKIKNITIAPDTFRIYRFRNYGDSLLDSPAKSDLRRSSCIFRSKDTHHIIVKISTSCQGRVSLYLDTKSPAVFNQFRRKAQRMAFDLINSRNDTGNFT